MPGSVTSTAPATCTLSGAGGRHGSRVAVTGTATASACPQGRPELGGRPRPPRDQPRDARQRHGPPETYPGVVPHPDFWTTLDHIDAARHGAQHNAFVDCIFVPGVVHQDTIRRLAAAIPDPLNVVAGLANTIDAPTLSGHRRRTRSAASLACRSAHELHDLVRQVEATSIRREGGATV